MKHYNRALDYVVLSLSELQKGNAVLSARLLAKAGEQTDLQAAINTLEASNKHAFQLEASAKLAAKATAGKSRLKASDEDSMDDATIPDEGMDADDIDDTDFSDDPLEEVADVSDDMDTDGGDAGVTETPGEAMAKVLSKMVRKSGRK